MVKSNAARHLLLVVSILLCFFVYMGYRIWGQPQVSRDDAAISEEFAGITPVRGGDTSLMTMNDTPSSVAPPVRVPVATPSGMPPALGGREDLPEQAASLAPPAGDGGLLLRPPASGTLRPPSGSIEESNTPSSAGEITGLVPAPSPTPPGGGSSSVAGDSRRNAVSPAADSLQPPPATASASASASDSQILLPPPPAGGRSSDASGTPSSARAADAGNLAPPPPPGPGLLAPQTAATGDGMRPAPTGRAGSGQPVAAPARGDASSGPESLRVYIIRPGDTLSRIAARELGSNAFADNIFLLNRDVISDPDQLLVGERILLPVRDIPGAPARRSDAPALDGRGMPGDDPAIGGTVRVHRVVRGDTLSSIALQYYGTSAGWRFVYESNRDVMANPNQLSVGTELVIPPLPPAGGE